MKHEMRLHDEPFKLIKAGTKTIELRLYDEKRQKIKLGDIITVTNAQTNEEFEVKVVGLLHYETFDDLFKDYDIEMLADKSMTKEELKNELEKFYPIEKQKQYSVLGIRVELNI